MLQMFQLKRAYSQDVTLGSYFEIYLGIYNS